MPSSGNVYNTFSRQLHSGEGTNIAFQRGEKLSFIGEIDKN